MKKRWLKILICNSISLCTCISGLTLPSLPIFIIGVILFGITFVGSIISLMVASGKKVEDTEEYIDSDFEDYFNPDEEIYEEDVWLDESSIEEKELQAINSAYGEDNQKEKLLSSRRESKILKEWTSNYWMGYFVLIGFLACIILALVFACMLIITGDIGWLTVTLSLMGVGAGLIVIAAIIVTITEKRSMWRAKKYEKTFNYEYKRKFIEDSAIVALTLISSYSQTIGKKHSNVLVYRVLLYCNGKKLTAFSRYFYNENEIVDIIYKPNSKLASIINEEGRDNFDDDSDEINY